MKKKLIYVIVLKALLSTGVYAQDYYVFTKNEGLVQIAGDVIDSVKIGGDALNFYQNNTIADSKLVKNVERIKFVTPTSAYPDGIPHKPGIVEAEDFDSGGRLAGYYNTGAWYEPDKGDYRDGTDGKSAYIYSGDNYSNRFFINLTPTDWYSYTINVPENGRYGFTFTMQTSSVSSVDLLIDDNVVEKAVRWPNSGWASFTTDTVGVTLTAGVHVLKIVLQSGGSLLDYFEFSGRKQIKLSLRTCSA